MATSATMAIEAGPGARAAAVAVRVASDRNGAGRKARDARAPQRRSAWQAVQPVMVPEVLLTVLKTLPRFYPRVSVRLSVT